jgi:hypothetical protein
MFNVIFSLTKGWDGFDPTDARGGKRGRRSKKQNLSGLSGAFEGASNLNSLEGMKLENILMVGNLNEALESFMQKNDGATDPTVSLPDGNSVNFCTVIGSLREEKEKLTQRCNELEYMVSDTRRQNDLLKVKMTISVGSLHSQIVSLLEDKTYLEEKCQRLSQQLIALRQEHEAKLRVFASLEDKVKNQKGRVGYEV